MIKINVTMELSEDWLESVVCSALEGGSNYWISDGFKVEIVESLINKSKEPLVTRIAKDFARLVITDEEDVIEHCKQWKIDRDTFIKGYERYVQWKTLKGYDIHTDASDIDGGEADIILQLGLFNEIIFG